MEKEQEDGEKKYWVFVSYSSKDKRWGKWLHHRLENYPIPASLQGTEVFDGAVLGRNLRPCFRDRDELTGAADLGPAIRSALEKSYCLVVLCSKNSAQSSWVNKEIEDFRAMGKGRTILALILDGEPNATSNPSVDDGEECFPPALRYPHEPLAGDLREDGDGKERGFLKILAGAAQLDFDVLYKRHERAQRKRRFVMGSVAALVIASLATLLLYAIDKEGEAKRSAAAERVAKEMSLRELTVSSITQAYQAATTRGGQLNALRALAQTPREARGLWEWQMARSLAGAAPLRLKPEDIALLETGVLKGSGLREDAKRLLDAQRVRTLVAEKEDYLLTQYDGGRGGGVLFLGSLGARASLFSFGMGSYDAVDKMIFSSDESCVLALTAQLATEAITLSESGVVQPGEQFIYIIPIPTNRVAVDDQPFLERDEEDEGEATAALRLEGMGNRLVVRGEHGQVVLMDAAQRDRIEMAYRPELDGYDSLPVNYRAGLHHEGSERQAEVLEQFGGKRGLFSGEASGAWPELLAWHDFGSGSQVLLYRPDEQMLEFGPLEKFTDRVKLELGDEQAKSIWQKWEETDGGAYTAGGDFAQNGSLLLCPLKGDEAVILQGADRKKSVTLKANRAYAQDQSGRWGGSEWLMSPKGTYAAVTVYDAPSSKFHNAVCDAKTGEVVMQIDEAMISRMEWSRGEEYYAFYDELNRAVTVFDRPGGKLLVEVACNSVPLGPLVVAQPTGRDLVVVGNTLLRRSDFRALAEFPDGYYLSDDWTVFAGRFRAMDEMENFAEVSDERAMIRIARAEDEGEKSQAGMLLDFQIESLAKLAGSEEKLAELREVLANSPERRALELKKRMGFAEDFDWAAIKKESRAREVEEILDHHDEIENRLVSLLKRLYVGSDLQAEDWVYLEANLAMGWANLGMLDQNLEKVFFLALGERLLRGSKGEREKSLAGHLSDGSFRSLLLGYLGEPEVAIFGEVYEDEEEGWLMEDELFGCVVKSAWAARDGKEEESLQWLRRVRDLASRQQLAVFHELLEKPSSIREYWWTSFLDEETLKAFEGALAKVGTEGYRADVLIESCEDAAKKWRTIPAEEIASPAVLWQMAYARTNDEEREYASTREGYLREAYERSRGDAQICLELAEVARYAGNQELDSIYLKQALERMRRTGLRYDWELEEDPLNRLASAASERGDEAEALALLESVPMNERNRYGENLRVAILLEKGKKAEALEAIGAFFKARETRLIESEEEIFFAGVTLARELDNEEMLKQMVRHIQTWGWLWLSGEEETNAAHKGLLLLVDELMRAGEMEVAYELARMGYGSGEARAKDYLPLLAVCCRKLNANQTVLALLDECSLEEIEEMRASNLLPTELKGDLNTLADISMSRRLQADEEGE